MKREGMKHVLKNEKLLHNVRIPFFRFPVDQYICTKLDNKWGSESVHYILIFLCWCIISKVSHFSF